MLQSHRDVGHFLVVQDHAVHFRLSTLWKPPVTPDYWVTIQVAPTDFPNAPKVALLPSGTTVGPGRPVHGFGTLFCVRWGASGQFWARKQNDLTLVFKESSDHEWRGSRRGVELASVFLPWESVGLPRAIQSRHWRVLEISQQSSALLCAPQLYKHRCSPPPQAGFNSVTPPPIHTP